jgi:hypothetical protein
MPRQFTYEVFIYNPIDKTQFLYHETFESVHAIAKALTAQGVKISKPSLDLIIYDKIKTIRPVNSRYSNIEIVRTLKGL